MKAFCATVAVGLGLMVSMGSASAQPYGRPGYGYEDRDYEYRERGPRYRERDYGYEERGPRYRERDYGYEERGPRYRGRRSGFDEGEYLRCNPDVRRAVRRGQVGSGTEHFLLHGRREGRRLSC
jgi:hypothetical protein